MTASPPAGTSKRGRTLDSLLVALQSLLLERGAGAFSISDVSERAGVAQGTFYNYASSLEELVDALAILVSASMAALGRNAPSAEIDPVAAFVFKTRHTLSLPACAPDYGRLLFDAGLPVDRFLSGLRQDLQADLRVGSQLGVFKTEDPELSASFVAGCMLGVGLDLHRERLPKSAIQATITELLVMLGVPRTVAQRAASERMRFHAPPALPLRWLSLASSEGTRP
ncbi:TetR/AcrR family transcriptional regulator [Marinicauda algicola]|nr:TetR/AcrR family transcriptional regulator [Marinicauda algicola]